MYHHRRADGKHIDLAERRGELVVRQQLLQRDPLAGAVDRSSRSSPRLRPLGTGHRRPARAGSAPRQTSRRPRRRIRGQKRRRELQACWIRRGQSFRLVERRWSLRGPDRSATRGAGVDQKRQSTAARISCAAFFALRTASEPATEARRRTPGRTRVLQGAVTTAGEGSPSR